MVVGLFISSKRAGHSFLSCNRGVLDVAASINLDLLVLLTTLFDTTDLLPSCRRIPISMMHFMP